MNKKKLAAAIASLGIAASSLGVVGLNEICAFDKAVIDVPGENTRICFKKEDDYKVFRKDILEKFEKNSSKGKAGTIGYFENLSDYHQFIGFVNEEKKRGNIEPKDILTNESFKKKVLSLTK